MRRALSVCYTIASDAVHVQDMGCSTCLHPVELVVQLLLRVQAFMAALVVLDTLVRAEYLKPFWGCWAYPAPSPTETGAAPL